MAVRNDPDSVYVNGSIGVVKKLHRNAALVDFDGVTARIEPESWHIQRYKATEKSGKARVKLEEAGSYTQLPLKLAYAITIHESQGQTYDAATIDPASWDAGQLYVALSRVRTFEGLSLAKPIESEWLRANSAVKRFYRGLAEAK